jgi:hypothetical protein
MPDKPYTFSTHIGAACAKQFRTFADLAEKLTMDAKASRFFMELSDRFFTDRATALVILQTLVCCVPLIRCILPVPQPALDITDQRSSMLS